MLTYKYVEEKGLAAMRLAGVTRGVNIKEHVRIRLPTVALNPSGDITRSQNRGISGLTKMTYVLQIFF